MSHLREWFSAPRLARYVFREHAGPFLFSLTIFTFIMLMNQVARQFQSLAGKGLGAEVIVEVFALSIPLTVAITIPMATLVATMAAFGRLAGDREILAIQANGIGLHQILAPTLLAAIALAMGTIWFNDTVLPESNHQLSRLMQDIQRTRPTVVLQEKRINDPTGLGEYRILPQAVDRQTNLMYGVQIFDMKDPQLQRTILADSGRLDYGPDGIDAVLTLWDGTIHSRDISTPREYERLDFETQRLVLRGVGSRLERNEEIGGYRSDREMDLGTLLGNVRNEEDRIDTAREEMQAEAFDHLATLLGDPPGDLSMPDSLITGRRIRFNQPLDRERYRTSVIRRLNEGIDYAHRQRSKFLVEYHKKFAIPVACLVFVLIGAPIGVRSKRGSYGFAMGLSTLVFVIYYLALTGGEDLADRRLLPPWLAMWLANLVFFAFGAWLLAKTTHETGARRLRLPAWWPGRSSSGRDDASADEP